VKGELGRGLDLQLVDATDEPVDRNAGANDGKRRDGVGASAQGAP
jgi:hypothetical protein